MPPTIKDELLQLARQMFEIEIEALHHISNRLNDDYLKALDMLDECQGKIVVTGLGKSGIAGKKISATLTSIGLPAIFLHSAEAGHGDLGVVSRGDVVIALSYSGETRELVGIIPRFKLLGVPVIALTGSPASTLGSLSDVVLDVSVPSHPWPFGLIPTASNVAAVAMGDALAITLTVKRGISERDFSRFHPGGLLGRKLLVKVSDLMHTGDELPLVLLDTSFKQVLMVMTSKRLGVACVVDKDHRLLGIFTDGDLRRLLEREGNPMNLTASDIMTKNPKSINDDALSASALRIMETNSITALPVVAESNQIAGLIHMHDIIRMESAK